MSFFDFKPAPIGASIVAEKLARTTVRLDDDAFFRHVELSGSCNFCDDGVVYRYLHTTEGLYVLSVFECIDCGAVESYDNGWRW